MSETLSDKLVLEEFKQLHEHMRQREVAMNQIITITTTGITTLLAAVAALVFQWQQRGATVYCYLLLVPMPFLIFSLSMLTQHRLDIYVMGYYINVFFEEKYGGAAWGIRLFRFQELRKGASHDAITLIYWSLFGISSALFLTAMYLHGASVFLNVFLNVPVLILLAVWLMRQNRNFHQDRKPIKGTWLEVMKEQEQKSRQVGT